MGADCRDQTQACWQHSTVLCSGNGRERGQIHVLHLLPPQKGRSSDCRRRWSNYRKHLIVWQAHSMQFALLIFAVLTIVGAFSTWRKSPLYSPKTTLKLIGMFLLIVVITVGTSLAILNGPVSRSPVAQGIAGFLAVIVLASGSSIFLVRITDSHVAELPSSVRLVSFNRHKVYQWIWRLLVFLLINTVAALVLPTSWKWLPTALGGFVLLLFGPTLSILYMMARRNDRGMSAVISNPWAHWQYTPEKWE